MNKKFLISILVGVVILVAGVFTSQFVSKTFIPSSEKLEITTLIENFGSKLKEVYVSDPKEIASGRKRVLCAISHP